MINLGDEVKDTVTGLKGIAVARTQWLHGCDRIGVQPKARKDGTIPDALNVDEPQLVLVKKKVVKKGTKKTGGPMPMPMQKVTSMKR